MTDRDLDFDADDGVMDLDDTNVPNMINSRDLDYMFLPKDEGEGFMEELERRIDDRIAQIDEDDAAQAILDEVYDKEDIYDEGATFDEDYEWFAPFPTDPEYTR